MAKKKIDVEMLKKNGFWIGLGTFVLLWLIGLIVVLVSGDTKARGEWETQKKAIEQARTSRPKTEAYKKPWNEHGEMFQKHKDKIWKEAWDQQESMYTWPEGMAVKPPPFPDATWGDDPNTDLNNRSRFRELYLTQFSGLDMAVAPVELAGGLGAVVPPQTWAVGRAPTREEIWLAQEDFWVRRELLAVVRQALNAVAYFEPVTLPKDTKLPEGIEVRKVYRNANWELDLRFEKDKDSNKLLISPTSTIKNIHPAQRTQALANPHNKGGLGFRLVQGRSNFALNISGRTRLVGLSWPTNRCGSARREA